MLSPYLHVLLVSVIVIGAIFYIRERRNSELESRMEYLQSENSPVIVEKRISTDSSTPTAAAAPDPAQEFDEKLNATIEGTPTASAGARAAEDLQGDELSKSSTKREVSESSKSTDSERPSLSRFIYAETDKEELKRWVEANNGTVSRFEENVQWGIVSAPISSLKQLKGYRQLSEVEKQFSINAPQVQLAHAFGAGDDQSGEQGLFLDLQTSEFTDQGMRFDLEAMKNLKEGANVVRRSYNSNFTLHQGQVFYLTGFLAHNTDDKASDPEQKNDPIFQILKSKSFTNSQSELTLLIFLSK
jgi:hypothetical protein